MAAGVVRNYVRIVAMVLLVPAGRVLSEPGKWRFTASNSKNIIPFHKTMFNETIISLKVQHANCSSSVNLTVKWLLRSSRCHNEVDLDVTTTEKYLQYAASQVMEGGSGKYILHQYEPFPCAELDKNHWLAVKVLERPTSLIPQDTGKLNPKEKIPEGGSNVLEATADKKEVVKRSPLEVSKSTEEKPKPENVQGGDPKEKPPEPQKTLQEFAVAQTWEDAPYMFILEITGGNAKESWELSIELEMKHPWYLFTSASEWPLMMFYMVMCIIYVLYGTLWLVLLACYWRDILRIQFWIGGVVLLGMLEKAVYYAEFQSIQNEGVSVQGAMIFAEVLSAVKRTLARVLVIIASVGYGIVKPRLGALLNRVIGVGMLYMLFCIIEGELRVKSEQSSSALLVCEIALAFVESCIVWWIFISLVQTMKLLRMRRNLVKLSLYRHFTNTLIFAVIASVIFVFWSTMTFRFSSCKTDWRELWIADAFWRFLFSVILLVIMFLWRPSANNQRYAFVPLVDEGSEEDEEKDEQTVNEAYGMKMRGAKNEANGILKGSRVDEDLKWVEENIPSSMADVVLPPLLDSDEEIVTTKFEMSKME
ncbi:transmembrane protein 87A isoform X2 [Microcaecilia unicolor]|uniref:Transmembrane protein 87A-like isoform X2 n=1 Tax=Microcaecilia unicolor TaxID=1415580 RepID=A0A6P7ZNN8_9AMPH|nr:transmembrane protein 87A-like isoform X2 [Microcaecilia unicolor]